MDCCHDAIISSRRLLLNTTNRDNETSKSLVMLSRMANLRVVLTRLEFATRFFIFILLADAKVEIVANRKPQPVSIVTK